MKERYHQIDPVALLLFYAVLIFAAMLIFVDWMFHEDGQIFQAIAGVMTGLTGAFLKHITETKKVPVPEPFPADPPQPPAAPPVP